MFTRSIIATAVLFVTATVQAAPVTIDFEGVPVGTTAPLTIDGFTFSTPTSLWVPEVVGTPGNQRLSLQVGGITDPYGSAGPIFFEMSRLDGQSFAYLGGDVTGGGLLFPPGGFSVTGIKTGGGIATDPIGTGDWLDLVKVTFGAGGGGGPGGTPEVLYVTADNLSMNVVPVPAAVWLFGSALGLLGWVCRR